MMSGLKIVNVEKEYKKYQSLYLAVVYAALAAMFAAYFSVFETDIPLSYVYGSMLAAVVTLGVAKALFVWAWQRPKIRKFSLVACIVVIAMPALGYRLWTPGLAPLINDYIKKYNVFYGTALAHMEKPETAMVFVSLFVVQFLLGAVFLFILMKGRYLGIAILVVLLPGILAAFVGYMPSPSASWGLLAAGVLLVIAAQSTGKKGWLSELAGGMLVLVILYGCAVGGNPVIGEYIKEHEEEYIRINQALLKAQELDVGSMLAEHIRGQSNYSKGGVGKGDFRNLSEHHPQGTKELEVVVTEKPTSRIYLRAFAGTDYTETGWKEMSGIRFAEVAAPIIGEGRKKALMNEPFRRIREGSSNLEGETITVRRFGASGEFGYTPYYAQIPDSMTVCLDAYVKGNGRREWEYEYFPSRAAESVGADELAKESADWEKYCAFVRENYREVPQGLEKLKQFCVQLDASSQNSLVREIDSEFASRLSYSLEPGQNAADEDFVEYFLFKNQKGFCVHFATAATLIYRECGYAARYVEGYAVSPEEFGEQSDGTYRAVVTDEMAHAWCETFDQDLGWQMREHTLAYTGHQSQPEELRSENGRDDNIQDAEPDGREEPEGENEEEEGADDQETQNTPEEPVQNQTNPQENEEDIGGNESDSSENHADTPQDAGLLSENGSGSGGAGKSGGGVLAGLLGGRTYRVVKKVCLVVGGIAISILFIGLLKFVWYRLRRQKKLQTFRKTKGNQGIVSMYSEIYQICIFLGMKDTGMSEKELEETWKCEYPYLTEKEWEWLCDCAVRAAFSQEKLGKEEWGQMYKLYKKFRRAVLKELKRKRRWLFLYGKAM